MRRNRPNANDISSFAAQPRCRPNYELGAELDISRSPCFLSRDKVNRLLFRAQLLWENRQLPAALEQLIVPSCLDHHSHALPLTRGVPCRIILGAIHRGSSSSGNADETFGVLEADAADPSIY
jgi:hypothetical protein